VVLDPMGGEAGVMTTERDAWALAYLLEARDMREGRDYYLDLLTKEIKPRKVQPMSQAAADALFAYRVMNDRGYQHLRGQGDRAEAALREAGDEAPTIEWDGK